MTRRITTARAGMLEDSFTLRSARSPAQAMPILRERGWLFDFQGLSMTPRLHGQIARLARRVLEKRKHPDGYVILKVVDPAEAPAELESAITTFDGPDHDARDDFERDVYVVGALIPTPVGVAVPLAAAARDAFPILAVPAPMAGYSDGELESVERRLGLR